MYREDSTTEIRFDETNASVRVIFLGISIYVSRLITGDVDVEDN